MITGCPLGAVVCSSGTFTGGVQGSFDFSILTLIPSATPGVSYLNGKLVLHTGTGDLRCDLNGALNTATASQGEFGEICVLTGGTGAYNGAKGHLRLFGLSTTSPLPIPVGGGGDYKGTIIVP